MKKKNIFFFGMVLLILSVSFFISCDNPEKEVSLYAFWQIKISKTVFESTPQPQDTFSEYNRYFFVSLFNQKDPDIDIQMTNEDNPGDSEYTINYLSGFFPANKEIFKPRHERIKDAQKYLNAIDKRGNGVLFFKLWDSHPDFSTHVIALYLEKQKP